MSPTQENRFAVVTGATSGFGRATAAHLAAEGFDLALLVRNEERGRAVGEELCASHGISVEIVRADLSSLNDVDRAGRRLAAAGRPIDLLVNNAGAIFERQADRWDVGVLEVDAETVAIAFDTNTLGAYRMMSRALPLMNDAGFGRIVNVTSGMGQLNDMGSGYPAYRMSKAALNAATRIFAHEAGPNVKVNCVCPGWVKTDMGGSGATRELDEGVAGIVWAATLPDDGPSNGFFRDAKPLDW